MASENGVVKADEKVVANFLGFDLVSIDGDNLILTVKGFGEFDGLDSATVRAAIAERIDSGKQPASSLAKELGRMSLHALQFADSAKKLLEAYSRMSTPQKRTSAATKARRALLEVMPNKTLKDVASLYMDISEYVLPDDRTALINTLLAAMANSEVESEASGETEQVTAE